MTQAMVNLNFGLLRRGGQKEKSLLDMEVLGNDERREKNEFIRPGRSGRPGWRERKGRGPYSRRSIGFRRSRKAAPDNTTQFLIGDQGWSRRTNDNSSESEDDFGKKEFVKDYDNQRPIRQKLSKSKLIEEYMTVEKDVKILEKKYEESKAEDQLKERLQPTEWTKVEPETAKKIKIFQNEVLKMIQENRLLRLENSRLVKENRALASSSTSSSSSSSSESSGSSSSDSSSEDEVEETDNMEDREGGDRDAFKDSDSESKRDDTGYESDRSAISDLVTSSFTSKSRT